MTWILAATPTEIINAGKELGTASNQVILGILLVVMILCIIALGAIIAWLHRDNKKTIGEFMGKMDQKETSMTQERKDRIASLMELMERDIIVQEQVKNAIENNTKTIERLETLLTKLIGTKLVL